MIELCVTVIEHRRTKPDSSWAVANVEAVEAAGEGPDAVRAGARFAAVGPRLALAAPGEGLRLRGEFVQSPYGRQFEVAEQSALGVQTTAQAHRWLERLDGVGPKLAARLAGHFGERVVEVLALVLEPGQADPLLEVEGIGASAARTIRESWGELGASGSLEDLRYLDGLGLTRFEANTVLDFARKRKTTPKALLEAEPFALVDARGFGFMRTDTVAKKAGCHPHAPARIEAAAVYQTEQLCDGDTMVLLGQLVAMTGKLLGVDSQHVIEAVGRLTAAGRLVMTRDEAKGTRWVHPPDLVVAERSVYRVLRAAEADELDGAPAAPLVQLDPAKADAFATVAASAAARAEREARWAAGALQTAQRSVPPAGTAQAIEEETQAALRRAGLTGTVLPWEGA